jgi:hypothetical protein
MDGLGEPLYPFHSGTTCSKEQALATLRWTIPEECNPFRVFFCPKPREDHSPAIQLGGTNSPCTTLGDTEFNLPSPEIAVKD